MVGALSGLNTETFERVSTPVFGELVRSTTHGCSFARVQYMNCLSSLFPGLDVIINFHFTLSLHTIINFHFTQSLNLHVHCIIYIKYYDG